MGFLNNFIKHKILKYSNIFKCLFLLVAMFAFCSFDFFKSEPTATEITSLDISGSLIEQNVLINFIQALLNIC